MTRPARSFSLPSSRSFAACRPHAVASQSGRGRPAGGGPRRRGPRGPHCRQRQSPPARAHTLSYPPQARRQARHARVAASTSPKAGHRAQTNATMSMVAFVIRRHHRPTSELNPSRRHWQLLTSSVLLPSSLVAPATHSHRVSLQHTSRAAAGRRAWTSPSSVYQQLRQACSNVAGAATCASRHPGPGLERLDSSNQRAQSLRVKACLRAALARKPRSGAAALCRCQSPTSPRDGQQRPDSPLASAGPWRLVARAGVECSGFPAASLGWRKPVANGRRGHFDTYRGRAPSIGHGEEGTARR